MPSAALNAASTATAAAPFFATVTLSSFAAWPPPCGTSVARSVAPFGPMPYSSAPAAPRLRTSATRSFVITMSPLSFGAAASSATWVQPACLPIASPGIGAAAVAPVSKSATPPPEACISSLAAFS